MTIPRWSDLPYYDLDLTWMKEHLGAYVDDAQRVVLVESAGPRWLRIPLDAVTSSGCLQWMKACNKDGYGVVQVPLLKAATEDGRKQLRGLYPDITEKDRKEARVYELLWEQVHKRKTDMEKATGKRYVLNHRCQERDGCTYTKLACPHRRCGEVAHLQETTQQQNLLSRVMSPLTATAGTPSPGPERIYTPSLGQIIAQVKAKKAKLMAENIIAKEEADAGYKKTMDDLAKLKASDEALPESYFEEHRHTQKPFIDPTDVMKGRVEPISPGAGPSLFYTIGAKTEPEKMLHDPPREGDWYEVGCRRSDCENSPYLMMLFGLDPEDWRKVDMEDGVMYPHSHRYHDEDVTSKAERSVLRELKERLLQRVKP